MHEAASDHSGPLPPSAEGRTLVLVVDDEEPLRRVVRRALEADGCTVLEAADGETALSLVQGMTTAPDLLVTDLRMPRLGGRELAEVLSVFRPELPVVGMTGFPGAVHPDRRLPLLVKPFTLPALLSAVQAARRRRAFPPAPPRGEQRSRAKRLRALIGQPAGPAVDLVRAARLLRHLDGDG